ncbi:MAG: thrombospondin type 3 repeat-containing protein [Candidatus Yonathbacteria bacterium]|nr:thrombospondin type 3 repeat-containing protein [Candidatus Yonathbacteria bacterium]
MHHYLPSKKLLLMILSVVFVGGGVFWVANIGKNKSQNSSLTSESAKVTDLALAYTEQDTDLDGLKDWEESLWGTDVKNPDTDGDGTSDGAEVAVKRDPTIAGPDDAYVEKTGGGGSEGEATSTEELSQTALLTREYFATIINLKESGNFNEGTMSQLSESLVQNFIGANAAGGVGAGRSRSDLRLTEDNSIPSLRAYGNAMGAIVKKYAGYNLPSELAVLARALETQDQSELKKLDRSIEVHKALIAELEAVRVPSSAANIHLALINTYIATEQSIEQMNTMFADPLVGMLGAKTYTEHTTSLGKIFDDLKSYFLSRGIFFEAKEPGYVFTQ